MNKRTQSKTDKKQQRISAKALGALAMPTFCPRCFWIQTRCQNRMPFTFMPGIFASIDSYSKKVTAAYFDVHGEVPEWFRPPQLTGQPLPVPHWSKFNVVDKSTGVLLTGVPDEILRRDDGSLCVLDYKTARFTEHADELLPCYAVQLNCYGYIAKAIGMGETSALGLLYYEPITTVDPVQIDDIAQTNGFVLRFVPKTLPIPIEQSAIPHLLKVAKDIMDLPQAPAGRADCKDCESLAMLHSVLEAA